MPSKHAKAALLGLALATMSFGNAMASVDTFTWNPAALGLGGAAFTADGITVKNYLRILDTNDTATLKQNFSGSQLQTVTGFTLGGNAVAAPGLGTSYGLYFKINPAGSFPINAAGTTIGPATYTALDLTLMADVGNDDGTLSVNAAALAFSNPAGTANDIQLASGILISASLGINADGSRRASYLTTFNPLPAASAFFVTNGGAVDWAETLNTPAAALSFVQVNSASFYNIADGNAGSSGIAQLVPEPASMQVMLAALLAVGARAIARRT